MMRGFFWKLIGVIAATCRLAFPAGTGPSDSSPTAASLGDSIRIGKPAPDFALPDQSRAETRLRDFRGKWVVLYFYPKDFTGGCTIEAHNFQRDSAAYEKAGAVILGVSTDDVGSHQEFCAKENLRFRLLADTAAEVSALYHSLKSWVGVRLSVRNTLIIDPKTRISFNLLVDNILSIEPIP